MSNYDVVGLGEMLIDFTPNGISEKGNVLFERNPGGGVANLVTAVSRLGGRGAFIGKVGNDMLGRFLLETLKENNVETKGMVLSDEYLTTAAFVQLEANGEREFLFLRKEAADTMLTTEDVRMDLIEQSKVLHVSSLTLTGGESPKATWAALAHARRNGVLVSFDPNWRPMLWESKATAKVQMLRAVKYTDIIKVSEVELELLTGYGEDAWEQGCAMLIEMGIKLVIITLGVKGAVYYTADMKGSVPGFTVKAVDATAAGDTCFGGFLIAFVQSGKSLKSLTPTIIEPMLRFANAAAALCVTSLGGIPSIPTRQEVEAFLIKTDR